jgi:radical SAM superfamily enzyme YgiQ (UPF0313 family)
MTNKISLITPPTLSHRTAEETIALGYLASILREAGYDVIVIDTWLEGLKAEDVVERLVQEGGTDLIAISCYRSNLDQAEETITKIRNRLGYVPVICGGYGPTFHDADFLHCGFTVAVRGEAEHIIVPLVRALLSEDVDLENISGISYLRDAKVVRTETSAPVIDLDALMFPARDTVHNAVKNRDYVHMCTARGCGAYCIFCSIFAFALDGSRHNRWRQRSVKNIVDEIEILYHQHGVRHFKFVDDSFIEDNRDESWAQSFRDELRMRDLKIRFRTQIRADVLTPRLVQYLAEAGWVSTSLGVENISPTALKRMLKTATSEQNRKALKLLKDYGVYVQMGMILFDPFTTMDELWENLDFLENEPWAVYKGIFTEMFAAEGTAFTRKLQRKGLLDADTESQNYRYEVQDEASCRVHSMLKTWHKSHAHIFDWVIDSITAPKVLPDEGYVRVHRLCLELRKMDVHFFRQALMYVERTDVDTADAQVVDDAVKDAQHDYERIKSDISAIYEEYGLVYDGVLNPFL